MTCVCAGRISGYIDNQDAVSCNFERATASGLNYADEPRISVKQVTVCAGIDHQEYKFRVVCSHISNQSRSATSQAVCDTPGNLHNCPIICGVGIFYAFANLLE